MRRLGQIFLVLAALALISTAALRRYLQSAVGQKFLREQVTGYLNEQIAGRLAIERVSLNWSGSLALSDVGLYDPQGKLVARIDRATARVRWRSLLRHRLLIDQPHLQGVDLGLVENPGGLNLMQALGRRNSQKKPSSRQTRWDLELNELTIARLNLSWSKPTQSPRLVLSAQVGSASIEYKDETLHLRLSATGTTKQPADRAFVLETSGSAILNAGALKQIAVEKFRLTSGASRIDASGSWQHRGIQTTIKELFLSHQDIPQPIEFIPPDANLQAAGMATVTLASIDTSLHFIARSTSARVEGKLDASLRKLTPLAGVVHVDLLPSSIGSTLIPKASARIQLQGQQAWSDLSVSLPGGQVNAHGLINNDRCSLQLNLELANLATFLAAWEGIASTRIWKPEGHGLLRARVEGPLKALAVTFSSELAQVKAGAISLERLTLKGAIPNIFRPSALSIQAHADQGKISEIPLHGFEAKTTANGRSFALQLKFDGLAGAGAQMTGEIYEHQWRARIDRLTITFQRAAWKLARPTRIDLRQGFAVDRFTLISSGQSVEFAGEITKKNIGIQARASHLDLARLPKWLLPANISLTGFADWQATFAGTTQNPQARTALSVTGFGFIDRRTDARPSDILDTLRQSWPFDSRQLSASPRSGTWALNKISARSLIIKTEFVGQSTTARLQAMLDSGQIALQTTAMVPLRAWVAGMSWKKLSSVPFQARLVARDVSLYPWELDGTVNLDAQLAGKIGQPMGESRLRFRQANFYFDQPLTVDSTLSFRGPKWDLLANLVIGTQSCARLRAFFEISPAGLNSIELFSSSRINAELTLNPTNTRLFSAFGKTSRLQAIVQGEATLAGTLGFPTISANAQMTTNDAWGRPWTTLQVNGKYFAKAAKIDAQMSIAQRTSAMGQMTLFADLGIKSWIDKLDMVLVPIDARLEARDFELQALATLLPSLSPTSGLLSGSGQVTGTFGRPKPRGNLTLRQGRFTWPGHGDFRDLLIDAEISDQQIELKQLFARAGSGSIQLTALGTRQNPREPYHFSAQAKLNRLPIIINDQLLAFITGSTLNWTGQIRDTHAAFKIRPALLAIDLPMRSSKQLQSLDPKAEVKIIGGPLPQREKFKQASTKPSLAIYAQIESPNNIWVQSSDAKIEVGTKLSALLSPGKIALEGEINTQQGRVDVMGKRFDIARGRLWWNAGDSPSDPRLDVLAQYDNLREQIVVKAHVTGTRLDPKVELSSDPPIDETEIANLLATGRRQLKRNSTGVTTAGATSALTAFAADRLRKSIAARLPIDVLQLEVGQGRESSRLEAGTYITDQVYLGYRRNFGAQYEKNENPNEVRVEYQLSPRITVESQYGDAGFGSASVVYTHDY